MPSRGEMRVFVAVIEQAHTDRAAAVLGMSAMTVANVLARLYERIGALNRAHAAALLFPLIKDRVRLPGEERRRRADRRQAA
jgi:DNA-binding CsgD family transcriptional regulator